MPRYSLDPSVYPSAVFELLRREPPAEAAVRLDSERAAINFQYKFWGLRKALKEQISKGNFGPKQDFVRVLYRAERTECTRVGNVVTFTPKELLGTSSVVEITYGREVDPNVPATEGDRIAREGEAKLLAMLSTSSQASAPDYAQAATQPQIPTKTLAQVLEEQALSEDDD